MRAWGERGATCLSAERRCCELLDTGCSQVASAGVGSGLRGGTTAGSALAHEVGAPRVWGLTLKCVLKHLC